MRAEMEQDIADIREEYKGRSKTALGLALMPFGRELGDMKRLYGEGLDSQSHGESFFKLFQARFVPNGLYLLDRNRRPLSLHCVRWLSWAKLMLCWRTMPSSSLPPIRRF